MFCDYEKAEYKTSTPELEPRLVFKAIRERKIDFVMEYLEKGGDPNVEESGLVYNPPKITLIWAVSFYCEPAEFMKVFLYLIKKSSIDINERLCDSQTCLHIALSEANKTRDTSTLDFLLEKGALIDYPDSRSLLFQAISRHNSCRLTKYLLSKGASWDIVNSNKSSPLCEAIYSRNIDIVKLLAGYGARVNEESGQGIKVTPLILAARLGEPEICEFLLESGANVNQACNDKTPIGAAASFGCSDVIKLLLAAGADVTRRGVKRRSLLAEVVAAGSFNSVKTLVEHGVEVDEKVAAESLPENSPIMIAVKDLSVDICVYLIEKGAKPTEQELFIAENISPTMHSAMVKAMEKK